jgi:hypothetical protein
MIYDNYSIDMDVSRTQGFELWIMSWNTINHWSLFSFFLGKREENVVTFYFENWVKEAALLLITHNFNITTYNYSALLHEKWTVDKIFYIHVIYVKKDCTFVAFH